MQKSEIREDQKISRDKVCIVSIWQPLITVNKTKAVPFQ